MLLIYEGGVLLLGHGAARNGIDVLLRWVLDLLGFGQYFLLPLLTAAILLAWHHTTGRPWRIRAALLPGMFLESAGLGLVLLLLAQVHGALFAELSMANSQTLASWSRMVAYFGAGIYEELLFRLMLLPLTVGLLKLCRVPHIWSLAAGLLLTSLIFSAAHYQMFTTIGDEFTWFSFVFRAVAGLFFSLLFLYRGFGIAVGAHALYDILVVAL
jgi:membrane protease YdiL (CAAX protease family)